MVQKIFNFLHKELSGLHQVAYLLGFCAFLSQVLALVRDRLLAYFFGAGHSLDIYYAAFRIPDFIFASAASLVSISVLIPFIIEKSALGEKDVKKFIDHAFSLFFSIIIGVCVVAYVFTPELIRYFFPTLVASGSGAQLITMSRILLLSPLFLGLSNFFASITQVYKRFFLYALSPLLYNVGIIFGILVFYPIFGLMGLAFGVGLGALFHFSIQVPFLIQHKLFPKLDFSPEWSGIKRVLLLSLPRTLTVSANELAEFFLVSFASFMVAGSISVFNFSWNLQSVPLSIIGVSYSLAAFPTLTRHFSSGRVKEFVEQMIVSSKHIIFWSAPAAILFIVLRAQIVRVILGSGRFSWADTRLTAATLALFVFSIIPQSLILLFVRSYYSRGNTLKPFLINLFSASLIVLLGYEFVHLFGTSLTFKYFLESLFKIEGVAGSSVLVLPLAFSIGATLNTVLHWVDFQRDFKEFSKPVLLTLFHSLSASIIMGAVSFESLRIFALMFNLDKTAGIFMQGFLSGILGILAYIIVLKLLKSEELKEIGGALHDKFWKAKIVVVPEQTSL